MPKEVSGIGVVYDGAELAQVLNVAESSIIRYWKNGRLPGQKVGPYTYFTADAVKGFLEGSNLNKKHVEYKEKKTAEPKVPKIKGPRPKTPERIREEAEQVAQILDAMKKTGNNQTASARLLNWPDRTFRERFHRYKLAPKLKKADVPQEPVSGDLFK